MLGDNLPPALIIVGASVRAAAESAVRAGLAVHAFDLFGDRDLQAIAHCTRIPHGEYPQGVSRLLKTLPPDIPWMYTGGIENHFSLIREIAGERPLLGASWDVARRTRDLRMRQAIADAAGWHAPRLLSAHDATTPSIRRPAAHCGGLGIHFADSPPPESGWEHTAGSREEFIEGASFAGTFLSDGRTARLLGVTRQYLARDVDDHPLRETRPFAYTGSAGPLPLDTAMRDAWQRLGAAILDRLPIMGVFGVDAIHHAGQQGWTLIETNPRYSASMELMERATGLSILAAHLNAWADPLSAKASPIGSSRATTPQLQTSACHAKRIVYAPFDIPVTQSVAQMMDELRWGAGGRQPSISDLPRVGELIRRTQPVATLFASGDDAPHSVQRLETNVRQFVRQLAATAARPSG